MSTGISQKLSGQKSPVSRHGNSSGLGEGRGQKHPKLRKQLSKCQYNQGNFQILVFYKCFQLSLKKKKVLAKFKFLAGIYLMMFQIMANTVYHTAVLFLLLISLLDPPREGVCALKALCCHTPWHPSCGAPHHLANQTHQCPNRAQILLKVSFGPALSLARQHEIWFADRLAGLSQKQIQKLKQTGGMQISSQTR